VSTCVSDSVQQYYDSHGTCVDGACQYPMSYRGCSGGCTNDVCTGPEGTGGGNGGGSGGEMGGGNGGGSGDCGTVQCTTPPGSSCADAGMLTVYSAVGTCSNGTCSYSTSEVSCSQGCMNGSCVNEPCLGVTCHNPPASACAANGQLTTYGSAGTCTNGQCGYDSSNVMCQFGCDGGSCVGDPCAGKSCNQPPASFCSAPTVLRTFNNAGSCAAGICSYTQQDVTCAFGCANGACMNDPCSGVSCSTPPATYCLNATTLRAFASPGACAGGSCTYAPSDTPCPFGCANGACAANPCQGVTCNSPPAATCVNANTARVYGAGTCGGNGTCSYSYVDQSCASGCVNGACNAPTCGGTPCNAPPMATCTSAQVKKVYAPVGTCAGTTCSYAARYITCSTGCFNGDCMPGSYETEAWSITNGVQDLQARVDALGQPHLVFSDFDGTVAETELTASGWQTTTIDPNLGTMGVFVAVATGPAGQTMVAYHDPFADDLRFAERTGSTYTKQLAVTAGSVGTYPALVVDPSGTVFAAYLDATGQRFATVRRMNGTWQTPDTLLSSMYGSWISLTLDPSGSVRALTGSPPQLGKWTGNAWSLSSANFPPLYVNAITVSTGRRALVFDSAGVANIGYSADRGGGQWEARLRVLDGSGLDELIAQPNGAGQPVNGFGVSVLLPYRDGLISSTYAYGAETTGAGFQRGADRIWESMPSTGGNPLDAVVGADGRARFIYGDNYSITLVTTPAVCAPQCSGRTCGSDGCGGSCGTCASGTCSPLGTCSTWSFETVDQPMVTDFGTPVLNVKNGTQAVNFTEIHSTRQPNGLWTSEPLSFLTYASPYQGWQSDSFAVSPAKVGTIAFFDSPQNGTTYQLKLAQPGAPDGGWNVTNVEPAQLSAFDAPQVFFDSSGAARLSQIRNTTQRTLVHYAVTDAGVSSQIAYTLASGHYGSNVMQAFDPSGVVHILWTETTSSTTAIWNETTNAGGAWTTTVQTPSIQASGQLFIGSDGVERLCYAGGGGYAYAYKAGATWTQESFPLNPTPTFMKCGIDPSGTVVAMRGSTTQFGGGWISFDLLKRTGPSMWSTEAVPIAANHYITTPFDFTYDSSGALQVLYKEYVIGTGTLTNILRLGVRR
jgi:hypothetical protein